MNSRLFLVPGMMLLTACTTAAERPEVPGCKSMECVGIGDVQQIFADFSVTPLEVLEDSRCPIEVVCVWAGRVRVNARLGLGHETITVELDSSKPMHINAGMLSIAEIAPDMSSEWSPLNPSDYRFGFAFVPDIMSDSSPG